jgi:hypothetical protein
MHHMRMMVNISIHNNFETSGLLVSSLRYGIKWVPINAHWLMLNGFTLCAFPCYYKRLHCLGLDVSVQLTVISLIEIFCYLSSTNFVLMQLFLSLHTPLMLRFSKLFYDSMCSKTKNVFQFSVNPHQNCSDGLWIMTLQRILTRLCTVYPESLNVMQNSIFVSCTLWHAYCLFKQTLNFIS